MPSGGRRWKRGTHRATLGPRDWLRQRLALVAERLLLAEDADRLVKAAGESWDVYQAL
jgi:hypothetical protein